MAVDIPKSPEDLPVSSPRFVGKNVKRVEDAGLVTGRTEFIDNVNVTGMLHCAILRSPVAHARIAKIDVSAAEKLPGVSAVVTGEDAKRWCSPSPAGGRDTSAAVRLKRGAGRGCATPSIST